MSAPRNETAPLAGGAAENTEAGGFGANPTRTVAATQVDLAQAARFLTLLDEEADHWHFRAIHPETGAVRTYAGSFDQVARRLAADNAEGFGVYVTVNAGGTKAADITRVRAVFADWDPPKTAAMPADLPLEPHIIVESSRGKHHAYWLVDGLSAGEFKATQQAIVARFGSDPQVCDPSRVMRLPGFIHCKPADDAHDGAPFQSRIVHESGQLPYSVDAIRQAFPVAAPSSTLPVAPAVHGDIMYGGRDNTLASLAGTMRRRGMSEPAILAALSVENASRCKPPLPAADVERIARSVARYEPSDPALRMHGQPAPRLAAVRLDDVMAVTESPVGYALSPYYPRRMVTLLGGHGGLGKSMLALVHAAHVAAGRDWGTLSVTQGRVVFLSFEDEGAILRWRLRCIIEAYQLPAAAVVDRLTVLDGSDAETELAIETPDGAGLDFTPMMGLVSEAVRGADLVFIDNASDTYGANENARRPVRKFVRRLAHEAKANNAAVVLLAHIDKSAARGGGKDNHYSGNTAWHNSARSRLALVKSEDGSIELLHEKANHASVADPVALQRASNGVLVPVSAHVAAAAKASAQAVLAQADAQDVLAALTHAVEALPDGVPTAMTGPCTTWHVLSMRPTTPAWMKARANKRRVDAALQELESRGSIRRRLVQRANRHNVERWEVAAALNAAA